MKLLCIAVGLLLAATSSEAYFQSLVDELCVATQANTEYFGYPAFVYTCLYEELGQQFDYWGKSHHICNGHSNPGCLAVPNNSNVVGKIVVVAEKSDEEGQKWTRHRFSEQQWVNGHGHCLERTPNDEEGYADILKTAECDDGNENQHFEFYFR